MSAASVSPEQSAARKAAMALFARAPVGHLVGALQAFADVAVEDVRAPGIGLVMIRGRIAGAGAPFNLGEATATRAAVRLATGETGWALVLGRDPAKARAAAIADALWQSPLHHDALESRVIAPLRDALAAQDRRHAERTAATRVDFFTLVRGED